MAAGGRSVKVVFIDDKEVTFEDIAGWRLLRSNTNPPAYTGDLELYRDEKTGVAVIGSGTFKQVSWAD